MPSSPSAETLAQAPPQRRPFRLPGFLHWLLPLILFLPLLGAVTGALLDGSRHTSELTREERHAFQDILACFPGQQQENGIWGADHRYGRLLPWTQALLTALPYHLGNEQIWIVSARSLQTGLLLGGYALLVWMLVKHFWRRVVALMLLVGMPYTPYYCLVIKPEPWQLFFLLLYVFWARRTRQVLGPHLLLVGLAWGLKMSLVPLALFVWGAGLFHRWPQLAGHKLRLLKEGGINLAYLLGGFLLADGYLLSLLFSGQWGNISEWYQAVAPNVRWGLAESPQEGLGGWISFLLKDLFDLPPLLSAFIFLLGAALYGMYSLSLWADLRRKTQEHALTPWLVATAGALSLLFTLLFVDDVRGRYLHLSLVFMFVGGFGQLNYLPEGIRATFKRGLGLMLTVLLIGVSPVLYGSAAAEFNRLAARSLERAFRQEQNDLKLVQTWMAQQTGPQTLTWEEEVMCPLTWGDSLAHWQMISGPAGRATYYIGLQEGRKAALNLGPYSARERVPQQGPKVASERGKWQVVPLKGLKRLRVWKRVS